MRPGSRHAAFRVSAETLPKKASFATVYESANGDTADRGLRNGPTTTVYYCPVLFLRYFGWIAVIVYASIPSYWIVVHPRARQWGAQHHAPLKKLGPIWFSMWVLGFVITYHWRDLLVYSTPWAWLAAVPFFSAGFFVYSRAHHGFTHDQILGRAELQPEKHEQRLVTTGIRQRVRHPIYLGHLLELVGWTIGTGMVVTYAFLAFAAITGVVMIRMEDAELEQRFGAPYREYRARVPAIVPRFW
jgi:protein-S-isoprenylcysteine O-methyltransferase Ste14